MSLIRIKVSNKAKTPYDLFSIQCDIPISFDAVGNTKIKVVPGRCLDSEVTYDKGVLHVSCGADINVPAYCNTYHDRIYDSLAYRRVIDTIPTVFQSLPKSALTTTHFTEVSEMCAYAYCQLVAAVRLLDFPSKQEYLNPMFLLKNSVNTEIRTRYGNKLDDYAALYEEIVVDCRVAVGRISGIMPNAYAKRVHATSLASLTYVLCDIAVKEGCADFDALAKAIQRKVEQDNA